MNHYHSYQYLFYLLRVNIELFKLFITEAFRGYFVMFFYTS